jgi:hypothetical protein
MTSISHTWGTTPQERHYQFPCDGLISDPQDSLFRGITIKASAATVFRWLCQMRVAPYSYDFIDNGGRQSPRQLTPGLDELALGQDVMTIFELADFERDRHFTIRIKRDSSASRTFGDIACSYMIVPTSPTSCRLLVKVIGTYPAGYKGMFMQAMLPWGDLFMMRRQLLTFKELAEGGSAKN